MALKRDYLVEKSNALNEFRANGLSLQELRFFSIYLAKINARDINTRVVRFTLQSFRDIMEFGRLNNSQIRNTANSLLTKVLFMPKENGGFTAFQLFKECGLDLDDNGEWYIEIDAHDKALPLLFELKDHYFTYELWNALTLKSANQLRIYEILKQYEYIGEHVFKVDELRGLIGIEKDEYSNFNSFKVRVLDACQQALSDHTDICFTYEVHGKRGPGGKILALKFTVRKNDKYVDHVRLEEFLSDYKPVVHAFSSDDNLDGSELEQPTVPVVAAPPPDPRERYDEPLLPFAEATAYEFSNSQISVLRSLLDLREVPSDKQPLRLKALFLEMNANAERKKIKDRFKYLCRLIESFKQPKTAAASIERAYTAPTAEDIEHIEQLLEAQQREIKKSRSPKKPRTEV